MAQTGFTMGAADASPPLWQPHFAADVSICRRRARAASIAIVCVTAMNMLGSALARPFAEAFVPPTTQADGCCVPALLLALIAFALFSLAVQIWAIVAFLRWIHGAFVAARELGATTRFSPRHATWAFVIPFYAWIAPLFVLRDLARTTDPADVPPVPPRPPLDGVRGYRVGAVELERDVAWLEPPIGAWFAMWALLVPVQAIFAATAQDDAGLVAGTAMHLALAILAVLVIRRIDLRMRILASRIAAAL